MTQNDASVGESAALEFVKGLINAMKIGADVYSESDAETFTIIIKQDEQQAENLGKSGGLSCLIGRRGDTLDCIQFLASIKCAYCGKSDRRLLVDVEGYREKRNQTLERLAHIAASKAVKNNRPEKLEPMNSFERMLIHSALANSSDVKTKSVGREPRRFVIVEPIDYVPPDPYQRTNFNRTGSGRTKTYGNKKRFF